MRPDEMQPQIIITKDGSHSLLNIQLNETYHSVHGALQESKYVFIEKGLRYWCSNRPHSGPVRIFEVGFGTGLNALLTLEAVAGLGISVNYTTIEAYPLLASTYESLNYSTTLGLENEFLQLHRAPWDVHHQIGSSFVLEKVYQRVEDFDLSTRPIDVVYFDAFAPSKQPEMWHRGLLEKIFASLAPGGVFVTYCAKGQLKRDLKDIGFRVETLPGPPGKKEMIRANKLVP
jgi:tRNA U34 5-methylaminomethyl-2-thiouridine-forming methyltransferase MnmC